MTVRESSYLEDVDESWFWAANEIDCLYKIGVVRGTGNGKYTPAANIQRGDFMLMLARACDFQGSFDGNFADVKVDSYFYNAIGIAKKLGIAQVPAGTTSIPTRPSPGRI